jgi:beta-N-acetylhexosaminidase
MKLKLPRLSRRDLLGGSAAAFLGSVAGAAPPDVRELSLEEKVGQLFLLAFEGTSTKDAGVLLGRYLVGSVYLSQHNLPDVNRAVGLMTELQRIGAGTPRRLPIFAGCDQEGAWAVMTPTATRGPGNLALGAAPPSQTEAMYAVFGRELTAIGVAGDLAPVADVNANPRNPIIGARSFGQDPQRVAAHVAAAVRGLHAGGARACAKHFPGHGDTSQDSHRELATVKRTREQILNSDLVPFRAAIDAGVDIVMTAHLRYPAFDTEWPATLSPAILEQLLRKQLGFQGVILTDSFSMQAIRRVYDPVEAATRALKAGADLIMLAEERYGNDPKDYIAGQIRLIEAIQAAVRDGKIPMTRVDEAVRRVLALKAAAGLFTPTA